MANNEKKSENTLVHDAIALFIITLIAGVLLGAVYMITKDPIAKADEKATNEAYAAVYQGAEFAADDALTKAAEDFQKQIASGEIGGFTDVELIEARTASVDGTQAGYVVKISGKGYGGAVKIALGITKEGEILGIQILDASNETPGLGQNSTKDTWNGQYIGMTAGEDLYVVKDGTGSKENGTINSISGATITSNAVTRAVNVALRFVAAQQ